MAEEIVEFSDNIKKAVDIIKETYASVKENLDGKVFMVADSILIAKYEDNHYYLHIMPKEDALKLLESFPEVKEDKSTFAKDSVDNQTPA